MGLGSRFLLTASPPAPLESNHDVASQFPRIQRRVNHGRGEALDQNHPSTSYPAIISICDRCEIEGLLRVSDARPQPSHSGAGLATIVAVLLLVTRHTPPAPSLAQLA